MSYFIVTIWSRKEAFHRDRFMFAKESSEFFFFPTAFNLKSHPSLRSRMSWFANFSG